MNTEQESQLREETLKRLTSRLDNKMRVLKEHAEHAVESELEIRKNQGEYFVLSEDEIDMLKAYRAFRTKKKPGSVFSWRTLPANKAEIIVPTEPVLVQHPQDVSEI
jgi:hypothetical protein